MSSGKRGFSRGKKCGGWERGGGGSARDFLEAWIRYSHQEPFENGSRVGRLPALEIQVGLEKPVDQAFSAVSSEGHELAFRFLQNESLHSGFFQRRAEGETMPPFFGEEDPLGGGCQSAKIRGDLGEDSDRMFAGQE